MNRNPPPRPSWLALAGATALLWLAWPLLRPRLWPAAGDPWLVVLDGYHRLDWALQRQGRSGEPILLITCLATRQPTAAQWSTHQGNTRSHPNRPQLRVLHQGFDTATQAVALAQWLQQRRQQGQPAPGQLLLVSDPHHFPRAQWAAQVAVGSSGSQVVALPVPTGVPLMTEEEWWLHWPSWRDALRLQLWRATGSTGASIKAAKRQRKVQACFASP
ncbi:YdcF family protein [Cyanobium sp. Aljojuca 7D2]|uniref:ElyC/SanA/YdcF family protein n=1 Tax=Cyanobium sp. Aljojuca 7D2 TaxID=2823698 RepID=UPI0020CF2827|nr:ElyC/SanA/YdcF family protein [Cyanobium sp. Aljojuca 7D2]MCP9890288.1 YdcF family protein [Cyanobium sp. Aljojuca 7D2]